MNARRKRFLGKRELPMSWDYFDDEEDWDEYDTWDDEGWEEYCEAALSHKFEHKKYFYDGDLLISEIIKQENGMYILASSYMLIADIDCGDDIEKPIEKLKQFVQKKGGSFRVYKTKNGLRYLQTDILYQYANKSAIAVLKALGSDPKYIQLCDMGKRFMARLTPKSDPEQASLYYENAPYDIDPKICVCHFLETVGTEVKAKQLLDSIYYHDFCTRSDRACQLN
jgi:hypothetical protein